MEEPHISITMQEGRHRHKTFYILSHGKWALHSVYFFMGFTELDQSEIPSFIFYVESISRADDVRGFASWSKKDEEVPI
jgi:hypothetical protein